MLLFLLPLLSFVVATFGANTTCAVGATQCADSYSDTHLGCCVLSNAICCKLGENGVTRNICCPQGTQCSGEGCTPLEPKYPCGPVQGENCTSSFVCSPGPLPWSPTPGERNVVVIGDSVSIGWTPVLKGILSNASGAQRSFVTHSPASGDGGARSTSDMLQCMQYRISTSTLQPLPLSGDDLILFNFGLHDYNLGLAGADEYESELTKIVANLTALPSKPKLMFVTTTPAHNTANPMDDTTVVELNKRAVAVMGKSDIPVIDLYTPIKQQCGAVPWADSGPNACKLCAPHCKQLSVHYTSVGYEFIANMIAKAIAPSL
eukprot:m.39813 g.39813  ORF g.39813 m.39813 type:complete len:319 (+) comp18294_c0_seq1:179-1135(+)